MKIAIGMVVRNLLSASPLTEFLDNAEKYGHPIDRVIVAYSHQLAPEACAAKQDKALPDPASGVRADLSDPQGDRRSVRIAPGAPVLPPDRYPRADPLRL